MWRGRGDRAGAAAGAGVRGRGGRGCSAGRGQAADVVQCGEVVLLPGPPGWEVQGVAAGVGGQSSGELEQAAAQGARGTDGALGQADQLGPAEHVVREGGDDCPGAVGVEVGGGEVREGLVFELGDDLLDDGVLPVLALDQRELIGAVGEQAEVPPVRPQRRLRSREPGAADDQAAARVGGLGDLRLPSVGVLDRLPGVLVDPGDGGLDLLDVANRDRVLPALPLQPLEELGVPEPGVGPEQDRAGGAGARDAGDQLVQEAFNAALGVRRALP